MRAFTDDFETLKPTGIDSGPGVFRFSTHEVAPGDRIEAWRETLGRFHIVPQVAPADERAFGATLEQHSYSCMSLSFIETSPASLSWPSDNAAKGDRDKYLLVVNGTRFDVIADGSIKELDAGDAILLSGTASVTIRLHASSRIAVIRFPAKPIPVADRPVGSGAFVLLSRSTAAFRFLTRHIKLLGAEGPTSDPVLVHRAANYLSELVALALEPTAPHCAEVRRKARLSVILDDVLAHISKPGLSAKTVAKRHGITDRYVHLLFKQSGLTFSRFVQEERLKRAFALLTNPDLNWMRISGIAFDTGFADLSTFNRAFRGRFGIHPKGVRITFATRGLDPIKKAPPIPLRLPPTSHDGVRALR